MNGYKWFEEVDVEVGKSWRKWKICKGPPETQMKKLKIKKIVAWEHNETIIKKKMLKNVVETGKKNMWNGKKNESIMRW